MPSDPKPPKREKKPKPPLKRSPVTKKKTKVVSYIKSGEKCSHNARKVPKKGIVAVRKWNHFFYQAWWDKKLPVCEECGTYVEWYNPRNIHHLILKSKQRSYSIDIIENEYNLMKLCWACHTQAHINIHKVPIVKARTETLLTSFQQYRI